MKSPLPSIPLLPRRVLLTGLYLFASLGLLVPQASAVILQSNSSNSSQTFFTASSTDLVNQGQATFENLTATDFLSLNGSNVAALNNGAIGAANTITDTAYSNNTGFTATFTLNTTVNTLGYDITQVNAFAAWAGGRANQKFTLSVSYVATPTTFVSFGTYEYLPFSDQGGSSLVSLTNVGGGVLNNGVNSASGVKAVRYTMLVPGGNQDYATAPREFDVIGAATVPEPSAFLMGLGGILMVGLLRGFQRRANRS